jgi:hypothetical protein
LEKINWTDLMESEEVLLRVKEDSTILPTTKKKKG